MFDAAAVPPPWLRVVSVTEIVDPAPVVPGAVKLAISRSGPTRSVRKAVLLTSDTSLTTSPASALANT